jgi:hypothetical protein
MKSRCILGLAILLSLAALPEGMQAAGATEHADDWVEVRSPHFTVKGNVGEKLARGIARQFEVIREVFQEAFPALRVDPGKPMIVLAVKNEESMKALLPDYWTTEGGVRPAGLYVTSFDENFAILRVDVGATEQNPYHALYHEYAHAILRLNYRELPAWLSEGLADFFGNTAVTGSDIELGHTNSAELKLLHSSAPIPLDELMKVDRASSLYNEKDRASIFYAESWALVHYLSLDPKASKNQPLTRYMKYLGETNDATEAARLSFGDLAELEKKLQLYSAQENFRSQRLKSAISISDTEFVVREMSHAEALVAQADFLQHSRHEKDAQQLLAEAIILEPKLAAAHACLGYVAYVHFYDAAAEKEFTEAAKLDPQDFRAAFYLAELHYRKKGFTAQTTPLIVANLEHATQLNANFAPAYAFLSIAYLQEPETRRKALEAALRASALEPTSMAYVVNAGNALMVLNREDDARALGEQLQKSAKTPEDKGIVQEYAKRLARHEEFLARKHAENPGAGTLDLLDEDVIPDTPLIQPSEGPESATDWQRVATEWTETAEGEFREVDCRQSPRAYVRFATAGEFLRLAAIDTHQISYRAGGLEAATAANPCSTWKGRKAKVTYRAASVEGEPAEILSIEFE